MTFLKVQDKITQNLKLVFITIWAKESYFIDVHMYLCHQFIAFNVVY